MRLLISNKPDIFLTNLYSQEFHSVFDHLIKTYVQNLSIIGSLADNLWRLQAWPVSQFFCWIWMLCKSYKLINIFSMKN